MIHKLRDFLVGHNALAEYCLAVEELYSSQDLDDNWYGIISGLFTWSEAESELGTVTDWDVLNDKWYTICNDKHTIPYTKDEFLAKLRGPTKKMQVMALLKHYKDIT